jgi:hypothetical protein
MGICAHEAAAGKTLDTWMAEPGGPQTIVGYTQRIRDGWWSDDYVAAIGQPYLSTRDWPLHQAAMFAWVHTVICQGRVAQIEIGVGCGPAPDRAREANAEVMADLPHPFKGAVDLRQKNGDSDGRVGWTEPVIADVACGIDATGDVLMTEMLIEPMSLPLEVGTTLASRTALHLCQDGGVARWAFDSDSVRVLIWVDEPMPVLLARRLASLRDKKPLPDDRIES